MVARLVLAGIRSISLPVDITNYVLMEMGQPLHAFDLAKLSGGIIVRRANDGEVLKALDESDYTLTADDLVIADATGPVAIAGIMGGAPTGVTETSTDVLLEAAHFQSSNTRRSSRRLALSSDSSYRFERGVDAAQTLGAADLAVTLILEIAGGKEDDIARVAGNAKPEADPAGAARRRRFAQPTTSAVPRANSLSVRRFFGSLARSFKSAASGKLGSALVRARARYPCDRCSIRSRSPIGTERSISRREPSRRSAMRCR
jgi:phenylalanyl-tRNA synthetase beta subunit